MNIDQLLTVSATVSVILVIAASIILTLTNKSAAPTTHTQKAVSQKKQKSDVANRIYSHDGKLIFFGDISEPRSGESLGDSVTPVNGNFSFFKK